METTKEAAIAETSLQARDRIQPDQSQPREEERDDGGREDLEEAFHDAGQFYWGRAEAWLEGRRIFAPHALPVLLPRHRVQDIDTPEDWERAEWLWRAMQAQG